MPAPGLQIPIAMIGVWKAGASYVICEDTYAPERIAFTREDWGCKLFISRDNWAELMGHDYLPGRETVQPLNPFQLFMFDYQLYAPYTSMYNLPHCWKYARKDIDSARLASAAGQVLRAHPIFRTRLRYNEDFNLVQYFDESMSTEVRVEHVTEGKMKLILPQMVQPFHLLLEPMYRIRIFETAEHVYMLFDVHHIIFDGTSLGVFLKDLTTAYNGGKCDADLGLSRPGQPEI